MFERLLALVAHAKAGAVGGVLVMSLTGALVSASLADGVAAVTLTQASPTTASVTSTHGAANNLTCAFSPVAITSDGASTSTATVTIRDANASPVSEGAYSITFGRTSGTSTTLLTANPQTTAGGTTTFTVRSTTTAGTDSYTAAITLGTTPTLPNSTSPACSISARTVSAPPADAATCSEARRSLDTSFHRYRAALQERAGDKRARGAAKHTVKQADHLLKGIRKTAKGVLRALGCKADDDESTLDLRLSGTDPGSIAQEADLAMSLVTNWARGLLGLPALEPGLAEVSPTPVPGRRPEKNKLPHGSVSDSDGSEDSD